MLDIFAYTDYRKCLRDLYAARKQANPAFSYRFIAQRAGIASPSFIGKILSGESNISQQTLMRLLDVFQLAGPEVEFFELMVNFDRARDDGDKSHYFQRMAALSRRHSRTAPLPSEEIFSTWYMQPLLNLVELGLFHGDFTTLGRMISPPISAREARLAIETLMHHGLVERDKSGNHRRASPRPPLPPSEGFPGAAAHVSDRTLAEAVRTLREHLPPRVPPEKRPFVHDLCHQLRAILDQARAGDDSPRAPGTEDQARAPAEHPG
ncbi:MAG: TIGR02147 family protein [Fibrobacteria bacterium]|nr:TIGR02147 family protein [Fibrobacteria bacterium]